MKHDAPYLTILSELATISAGYPLRTSAEALVTGETSFVQLRNVNPEFGIEWETVSKVELPQGRKPKWLTKNDVIFSARGARSNAYSLKEVRPNTVCAPHFFILSIKDTSILDPDFLTWQINEKPAQEYFKRTAVGTQAIVTVRRPAMEQLPIAIPSLKEQLLIGSLYETARKERAALTRLIHNRNQQLEAIALSLHQKSRGTK